MMSLLVLAAGDPCKLNLVELLRQTQNLALKTATIVTDTCLIIILQCGSHSIAVRPNAEKSMASFGCDFERTENG
jgi:hypothetical protein